MEWKRDLTADQIDQLRPWMWALNESHPNMPPMWGLVVPYLFTPLVVCLFLNVAGFSQPGSVLQMLRDWGIYALVSTISACIAIPFAPILKRYIYGPDKINIVPRISPRQEHLVKGTFLVLVHIVSSGVTAIIFLGFSGRGWTMDGWWTKAWIMALVSLPALIPSLFSLVAKIKLVSMIRAKNPKLKLSAR